MSNEVTIDSYSKQKLWGIVKQQGHVVATVGQILASDLDDAICRKRLLDLFVQLGVVAPKAEPLIALPDQLEFDLS